MKIQRKRIWYAAVIITILATTFMSGIVTVNGAEHAKRKVKIGCSVTTGYYQYDEQGNIDGYGYDYEDILSQYADWDITYVEGTWSELNQMLAAGEIDMLGFLVKTEEREEVYDFADSASGTSKSCLITLESNDTYYYNDFENFDGMTVGYQSDNANAQNLKEWCQNRDFSIEMKEYPTITDVYTAMENGEIDATLVTNFNLLSGYRIIAKMLPENIYYAVTKGNDELLNELNIALDEVLLYYPDIADQLYLNYYDEKNGYQVAFTKEEMTYLKTQPVVSVFPGSREAPYEKYNESTGAYEGIIPDVLAEINRITGIEFQYVRSNDRWSFKDAEIEGNKITSFTSDFSWAKQNDVIVTPAFIDSDISVITKEPNTDIHTIAAVENRYIGENVERLYPDAVIKNYNTVEDCFKAVQNGECDATYVNSIVADHFFTIGRYSVLHEEICEDFTQDICFGVTKDSDEILNSVLSKALLMISSEQYSTFVKENVNANRSMEFWDLIYTNPEQILLVMVIMAGLLLLVIAFAVQTRRSARVIKAMSNRDVMTGILNRSALEQKMMSSYDKPREKVSCLYIDANGLHEINNEKGHDVGDMMLHRIAEALTSSFSMEDVFRIGGDEFLIIALNESEDVIDKKIQRMEKQLEKDDVSVSVGKKFAEHVADAEEMRKLIKEADIIMLEEKQKYYQKHERRKRV